MRNESTNDPTWHEYGIENVAAEVDQRLLLMQEYVALDREQKRMNNERKAFEERGQKLAAEFQQVSERLRSILGFEDSVATMKKSLDSQYGGAR